MENTATYQEPNALNDEIVNEETKLQPTDVYYTFCVTENLRIGGYSGDLTVINNRTSYHRDNNTRHVVETRRQS